MIQFSLELCALEAFVRPTLNWQILQGVGNASVGNNHGCLGVVNLQIVYCICVKFLKICCAFRQKNNRIVVEIDITTRQLSACGKSTVMSLMHDETVTNDSNTAIIEILSKFSLIGIKI